MKYIIFGASNLGINVYKRVRENYNIVAFCDNDKKKWGESIEDIPVISPEKLNSYEYEVIIASMYHVEIVKQLLDMKILKFYVYINLNLENQKMNYYNYEGYNFKQVYDKILIIDSENSSSNSICLYKYLRNNDKLKVSLISERDKDYYYKVFTSKIIIKSQDTTYIPGKINIQLWHGIPMKGLNYTSKTTGIDKEQNHKIWNDSYIMSYSQMYNILMGSCYGIEHNRFMITGMPRNDMLLESKGRENIERLYDEIKGKKIIFYLPTFRQTKTGEVDGNLDGFLFKFKNLNDLDKYLIESNSILIAKLHPFEKNKFKGVINKNKFSNIYILEESLMKKNNFDLYEILNSADILITDYSSVYFDFLLLDRPIIFINKDLDDYKRLRGIILEPYEYWAPGEKCNTIEELILNIKDIYMENDSYKERRNEIKNIMHKYSDYNSRKRIENLIIKLLENGGE